MKPKWSMEQNTILSIYIAIVFIIYGLLFTWLCGGFSKESPTIDDSIHFPMNQYETIH